MIATAPLPPEGLHVLADEPDRKAMLWEDEPPAAAADGAKG
mgnify:CR=1 FL=1